MGKVQIQNQGKKPVWLDVSIVQIGQIWAESSGNWAQLKNQLLKLHIFVNAQAFGFLIGPKPIFLSNFNLFAWVKC